MQKLLNSCLEETEVIFMTYAQNFDAFKNTKILKKKTDFRNFASILVQIAAKLKK